MSKKRENSKNTKLKKIINHKSCGGRSNSHKTLNEQMKEFLNFNRFIHRAKTLKFRNVFDIIVQPVWKRTVIHSPVIHSSRRCRALFLPPFTAGSDSLNADAFISFAEWRMTA